MFQQRSHGVHLRIRPWLFWLALLPVAAEPPFPLRMASGETNLARYREAGANVVALGTGAGLTQLATYAEVAPTACPLVSSAHRDRAAQGRNSVRKSGKPTRLGLAVCIGTDEIQIPTPVFDALRSSITRADDPQRVDLDRKSSGRSIVSKYREVLRAFPEIAYVQVRTGGNYSHLFNGYTGLLIAEKDFSPTRSDAYVRNMQRLIDETRRIVVDEFHRKLIGAPGTSATSAFTQSRRVRPRIQRHPESRRPHRLHQVPAHGFLALQRFQSQHRARRPGPDRRCSVRARVRG
jgi:hypothetical protein